MRVSASDFAGNASALNATCWWTAPRRTLSSPSREGSHGAGQRLPRDVGGPRGPRRRHLPCALEALRTARGLRHQHVEAAKPSARASSWQCRPQVSTLLHLWLEDAAGNQREANSAVAAPLRFDPEAPQLAFAPGSPEDPLRVAASVSTGIPASRAVRSKCAGRVHPPGTRCNTTGGHELVAYVDDQRFRDGTYEFRAHAVDNAGNEASTGSRADGTAASLRLPARVDTRLEVGVRRTFIRRTVIRRHGQRRVVRTRVADSITALPHDMRADPAPGSLTNADGSQ